MGRKINWRETWRRNGTPLMLFALTIRPLIIVPLLLLEIAGEWARKAGDRIPAARAIWRDRA